MTPRLPKYYWDACAWIAFINREARRIHPLQSIWSDAEAGKCEIWTSAYSYLEVIKGALAHGEVHHPEGADEKVDSIFAQPWVQIVQLDGEVAKFARKLRRDLAALREELGKQDPLPRPDAIHLATAAIFNCDQLHTWDGAHLTIYDRRVPRLDGVLLDIKIPGPEVDGPLFSFPSDLESARLIILQLIKQFGGSDA